MVTGCVTIASRLNSPAANVWARVTSFEGINDELRPLLRMTAPAGVRDLDPARVVLGERICRSWILLLGVAPFDYDDVVMAELDPGRRFLERSRMLSQRVWEHERSVDPDGPGRCVVTDRLTFEPRVRAALPLVERIVGLLFRYRHRRLRRRFG